MTTGFYIDSGGAVTICATDDDRALAALGMWKRTTVGAICGCGCLLVSSHDVGHFLEHDAVLARCNVGLLVEHACRVLCGASQ